ncbi:hypothetical protein, unlikely [Trypanosoma brucei gambiense DAL972]|uniref:Uncharacterized protein n=1 Tax=Trypanosoma brucei gambiense (strain MHOM/CI/86/DAL972) TaxID=679716 RepID=D0A7C1_TRYB9|nr:hypothetical protein, unlikely [Trypanosoma brucei gambiense DAL972]CBH17572.1 hypothetical protein, unlikely [Trypanosoma brucei gambiense DAL972]|eukprot:XP_011779836.1 hypothetical protein, unlikely [Trypanosoma brucei gambiense DAL972]
MAPPFVKEFPPSISFWRLMCFRMWGRGKRKQRVGICPFAIFFFCFRGAVLWSALHFAIKKKIPFIRCLVNFFLFNRCNFHHTRSFTTFEHSLGHHLQYFFSTD